MTWGIYMLNLGKLLIKALFRILFLTRCQLTGVKTDLLTQYHKEVKGILLRW